MAEIQTSSELQELWEIEKAANSIKRLKDIGLLTVEEYAEEHTKLKAKAKIAAAGFAAKTKV